MGNSGNNRQIKLTDGRLIGYTEYGILKESQPYIFTVYRVHGLIGLFLILTTLLER